MTLDDDAHALAAAELSADERELLLLVLADEAPAETVENVDTADTSSAVAKADAAVVPAAADATTEANAPEAPARKVNPRRNRKRRKHEVDALRVQMRELTEKLAELQERAAAASDGDAENALVATHVALPGGDTSDSSDGSPTRKPAAQWIVITSGRKASAGAWETLAWTQRESAQAAAAENVRLRFQYENQLQTLRQLEMLYSAQQQEQQQQMLWGGDPLSIPWRQHLHTATAQLSKRARLDPFDADAVVFAALGRDFDAQFAKTDAIYAAVGLAAFEGNLKRGMVPKRGDNGIYFLENLHSKLLARGITDNSEQRWSCMARADLHPHHDVFEVREKTHDTMFRKLVSAIRLPNAEATLVRRTAMKRFIEPHRVVFVWDAAIEIGGAVSMRLRERGWKVMRTPRVLPANYDGGAISLEQGCSRITPELWSTYVAEDIAPGSLTNTVVGSYRRHMKQTYFHTMEILAAEFGEMTVRSKYFDRKKECMKAGGGCGGGGGREGCSGGGGGGRRHHFKKELWHHGECARPPPAQMMQLVEL